jgi:hypothetical protein
MYILTYGSETWAWTKATISRQTAAEMRFLKCIEGKIKRKRIRRKQIGENLKINTLKDKLTTTKKRRWHGQMMEQRENPREGFDHETKRKMIKTET